MLVLILIRPQWCPSILCPSQQIIRVFHQQGNHDDNLEVYFIATQSKSYAIPGDPAQYSQANLPTSIAAIPANGQNSMLSYHLILGLQNLRQEASFGLIIEEVNIVIQKVFPIPYPLNVWNSNLLNDYSNSNQYRGLYFGQDIGSLIPTNYLRFPNGFVHLNPGETDQIDLHIISRTEAGIGFYVQVIYRNDNEQRVYTLKLTQLFEIMFANTIDWYLYLFQNGHFIKSP